MIDNVPPGNQWLPNKKSTIKVYLRGPSNTTVIVIV